MSNIYIFALYATTDTSIGTDLEIAQTHLNKGDSVTIFICEKALERCDRNRWHNPSICDRCITKVHWGISLLQNRENLTIRKISSLPDWNKNQDFQHLLQISDINQLKKVRLGNYDIGYAILSSLISWKKHANPPLDENRDFLVKLYVSSARVYNSCLRVLKDEQPDIVYVFNGRYAPMRAIVRACQKTETFFYTQERGNSLNHYALYERALLHDLKPLEKRITSAWNSADPEKSSIIARKWFEDRSQGKQGAWKSFITRQRSNNIPTCWNNKDFNIVIFTSSEHEFASIGPEWEDRLFDTQVNGIKFLADLILSKNDSVSLYVRIHPNQENAHYSEVQQIIDIEQDGLKIIMPKSPVSSYELLKKADIVITFGSTVGLEAVHFGTPSILLGQSAYKFLDATYNPDNKDELKKLINSDLRPKQPSLAYPYAYYCATLGKRYCYYEATGLFTGNFLGQNLETQSFIKVGHRNLRKFARKFRKFSRNLKKTIKLLAHPHNKPKNLY